MLEKMTAFSVPDAPSVYVCVAILFIIPIYASTDHADCLLSYRGVRCSAVCWLLRTMSQGSQLMLVVLTQGY